MATITCNPGDDIAAKIAALTPADTLIMAAGTYRAQRQLEPPRGAKVRGG